MKIKLQTFVAAILFLFLLPMGLQAQETAQDTLSDADNHRALLQQAQDLLFNTDGPYDQSIAIYQSLAEQNDHRASFMLGKMYLAGKGFEQNRAMAVQHFLNAVQQGSRTAPLYIAVLKMQDDPWTTYEDWQENAKEVVQWYAKSVALGSPDGYYSMGYAYFQGFGVEQNYQKAIEYFIPAAAVGHLRSAHMLGISLLCGYGVERNTDLGKQWIKYAADNGNETSIRFWEIAQYLDHYSQNMLDENGYLKQAVKFPAELDRRTPPQYQQFANNVQAYSIDAGNSNYDCAAMVTTISGDWSGKLVTYDWSGQIIIEELPVELSINEAAGEIYATWSDKQNTADLHAALSDNIWAFTAPRGMEGANTVAFRRQPMDLKFATFHYECGEEGEFLSGNLWRYAPQILSFTQPSMIVLMKNTPPAAMPDANMDILVANSVVVYPNPFSELFSVSFTLSKAAALNISIYSNMGTTVYNNTGNYREGDNVEHLWLSGQPGIYTLRISGEGVNYLTQIVKM